MDKEQINRTLVAASVAETEGYNNTAAAFIEMVKEMQRDLKPRRGFEVEKTIPPSSFGH